MPNLRHTAEPLPAGTAGFCFVCDQLFTAITRYYAHRDMNAPTHLRRCLTREETAAALALAWRRRNPDLR